MSNSKLVLRGQYEVATIDNATGEIIDREKGHNLIVAVGKERVAKLLCKVETEGFDYIAIGTGTTAAAVGDTGLETEVDREAATLAYEADYKATFEKTFTFGTADTYAITEAAVSDSDTETGECLLNRFVFTAKNVDIDISLYIKVTITVG